MRVDEARQQELIMQLHPEGAHLGSSFLLFLKDDLSFLRVSGVPLCSPLSVFWVFMVCSLHLHMIDPRDNTCNVNCSGGSQNNSIRAVSPRG